MCCVYPGVLSRHLVSHTAQGIAGSGAWKTHSLHCRMLGWCVCGLPIEVVRFRFATDLRRVSDTRFQRTTSAPGHSVDPASGTTRRYRARPPDDQCPDGAASASPAAAGTAPVNPNLSHREHPVDDPVHRDALQLRALAAAGTDIPGLTAVDAQSVCHDQLVAQRQPVAVSSLRGWTVPGLCASRRVLRPCARSHPAAVSEHRGHGCRRQQQ